MIEARVRSAAEMAILRRAYRRPRVEPRYDLLIALRGRLRRMRPTQFDYRSWVGRDWGGAPDLSCGTTACALGWATTLPGMRGRLRLYRDEEADESSIEIEDTRSDRFGIRAGAAAFGISDDLSRTLFIPDSYSVLLRRTGPDYAAGPREVADWIRDHVAAMRRADRSYEAARRKAAKKRTARTATKKRSAGP